MAPCVRYKDSSVFASHTSCPRHRPGLAVIRKTLMGLLFGLKLRQNRLRNRPSMRSPCSASNTRPPSQAAEGCPSSVRLRCCNDDIEDHAAPRSRDRGRCVDECDANRNYARICNTDLAGKPAMPQPRPRLCQGGAQMPGRIGGRDSAVATGASLRCRPPDAIGSIAATAPCCTPCNTTPAYLVCDRNRTLSAASARRSLCRS